MKTDVDLAAPSSVQIDGLTEKYATQGRLFLLSFFTVSPLYFIWASPETKNRDLSLS
jgi:hypothetical protein